MMAPIPETGTSAPLEGSFRLKSSRPRSRTSSGGILRLDIKSPHDDLKQVNPPSPQPSVDRLSVTFATEDKSANSESSVKINLYDPSTPPIACMEKVRFPTITDGEDSDEDYSASVTAIMQRRASTRKSRKKGRRTSSPFSYDQESFQGPGIRRSSCYTTSSGDTAISMEESLPQEVTQEQIFENIRLHKEVLSSVKMQPWCMRRKVKLVQQAKSYIKRHEGVLQERLAQSRSTRDILARWNIFLVQKWQHYRRELANLSNWLIPWESRIKEIESHFGSVVASYFTFLRWLFWVNVVITIVLVAFVAIPELLTADPNSAGERKLILPEEKSKSTNLLTLWDFEGVLKYSPLFYGYYTNRDGTEKGYRLPFAYFMTGLGVYVYSFVATLRKMAENSRMSKLSEKDDECVFTWKLFTGWDYMIGNAETAHNRVASIILGFKEALLEEAEKKREPRNWKNISLRIFVNFIVVILLGLSAWAVVLVVQRSTEPEAKRSWWRRNEITVVMSSISLIFPIFFELLGLLERYHPRRQLRLQLARIMVLNLLNLYALIFALFVKIGDMTIELQQIKNETGLTLTQDEGYTEFFSSELTTPYSKENIHCQEFYIDCTNTTSYQELKSASLVSALLGNLSVAMLLTNRSQTPTLMNEFKQNTTVQYSSTIPSSTTSEDLVETGLNFDVDNNNDTDSYYNGYEYILGDLDDYYSGPDSEEATDSYEIYDEDYSTETNVNGNDTLEFSGNTTTEFVDSFNFSNSYESTTSEGIDNITESSSMVNILMENETSSIIFEEVSSEATNPTFLTTEVDNFQSTITTTSSQVNFEETFTETSPEPQLTTGGDTLETLSSESSTEQEISSTQTTITHISKDENRNKCLIRKCSPVKETTTTLQVETRPTSKAMRTYDSATRKKLRSLCWETMFGQELVKLTVMDLFLTIFSILMVDFLRAIFVRIMNNCWCWDLEKQFPQYGDFKIAENILHLVNNQGQVWMGLFFSPGLAVINLVKLAVMMYLRSWAVLTCNVPHEVVFRASRSNNFYLALLLTMLFLCVLPVGYAIVWEEPSWHCGPFSNYKHIYHIFTKSLQKVLPKKLHRAMDYIASPGIVIPLLVLLVLIIYYMISLTNALREANNDLKLQLRRERTEERRKMFQIADRRRRNGSGDSGDFENTPFGKWKKLLPMLPASKSFEADGSTKEGEEEEEEKNAKKNTDFLVNFIKRAMKKPSLAPKSEAPPQDDATDTENHESLPHDVNKPAVREKIPQIKLKKLLNNAKNKQQPEKSTQESDQPKSLKTSSENIVNIEKQNKREKVKNQDRSISKSSSSKDFRQDSITSNWSENIPVIKISSTGSSECILEQPIDATSENGSNRKPRKITHQHRIEMDLKPEESVKGNQVAKPQEEKLMKTESGLKDDVEVKEEIKKKEDTKKSRFIFPRTKNEDSSVATCQNNDHGKSTNGGSTGTSTLSKTESSTAYKE